MSQARSRQDADLSPRKSGASISRAKGAHLAFFIPSLAGGGVARVVLTLAGACAARGHLVDLVLCRAEGSLVESLPPGVRVIELEAESEWRARLRVLAADIGGFAALLRPVLLPLRGAPVLPYLDGLSRYLRQTRPSALFSAKTHANLLALWARRLAGVPTRIVISERTNLSRDIAGPKGRKWRWGSLLPLVHRVYPWADAITTVSNGVADDLATCANLPRDNITTVYNPLLGAELLQKARAPLEHPWFAPGQPPVLLGAGRLVPQKDFATLIRAFARVRARRAARLMILGDGKTPDRRAALLALAEELGVAQDVALPGHQPNPFAYMARASLFVLSSAWEGLPGVLIQALACGCPVVSTDCPSGPAEILEQGRFGRLVAVGDVAALADAIVWTLDNPPERDGLRARGAVFSDELLIDRHLAVLLGRKRDA